MRDSASDDSARAYASLEMWLGRYQTAIAVPTVGCFFTFAAVYLYRDLGRPIPPVYWIWLLMAASFPLLARPGLLGRLWDTHVPLWSAWYFSWTITTYLWARHTELVNQELRLRVIVCIALPLFVVVFAQEKALRAARITIAFAVLLAVATNAYELPHPAAFSQVIGRSAGLYGNPNVSATAILCGLIISFEIVPTVLRAPFAALAGLGIALTLSRGLTACYVLVLLSLFGYRKLSARRFVWSLVLCTAAAAATLYIAVGSTRLQRAYSLLSSSRVIERLTDPSRAIGGADYSANMRGAVLVAAWDQFKEHPLAGNGVGSTIDWEYSVSTHNIYVRHLAEYGILGVLILPLLIMPLLRNANAHTRWTTVTLAITLLLSGFVSHNLLDEWDVLISLAVGFCLAAPTRLSAAEN